MFAERLDFLMKLTNTTASSLGKACSLDASHISRLRNGSRKLPKHPEFLSPMSQYLARHVREEYQKDAICESFHINSWPHEEAKCSQLIHQILLEKEIAEINIPAFLSGFTSILPSGGTDEPNGQKLSKLKHYYYGPFGKQEAVLQFFQLILKEKYPQTLLLSSEEEMSWLSDDPVYAMQWASEFQKVIQAGNRVRMIHNIGRNLSDLIESVAKWIPIYMTGMIEPYYYPRLRDGVTSRTLFIAPKTSAIVSTSIGQKTDDMLNELITDHDALSALTIEFNNYLALCRPLMNILTAQNRDELWLTWNSLSCTDGSLIYMCTTPSLATMPRWVAEAMQERAPKSDILKLRDLCFTNLTTFLQKNTYTEQLPFDDTQMKTLTVPYAEFLGAPNLCYTPEELNAHRINVTKMAEEFANFQTQRQPNLRTNLLVCCKQDHGVIVMKISSPCVAFAISEKRLTDAFYDYYS